MHRMAIGLLVGFALLLAECRLAAGEVFVLHSGGRVVGELLNPDQSPRENFVIQSSAGARITLDRSQVKQVLHRRAEELLYEKIRPRYPDTVDGQWTLAEWCRQQRLSAQRRTHLERIVELDGGHAGARRALGFSQVGGKWVRHEEEMLRQGYRRYQGRWMLPQEIELIEKKRKLDTAEKQWYQKLRLWRRWLSNADKAAEARAAIYAIDDPSAAKALASALADDRRQENRLIYADVLAKIENFRSVKALAVCSLQDPAEELRLSCLDHLQKISAKRKQEVVAYYVGRLRDKDNRIVNRAALGLNRMNDPSAIGPLIDALATTHKFTLPKQGGIGNMNAGFRPDGKGSAGLNMGGKPKVVRQRIPNRTVLDALMNLTGENFDFNRRAWKDWLASQRQREAPDVRRD